MENNRMKLPLFDDFWIDFQYNVKRRWFAPELYATCDTPGAYSSLLYDPERHVYRLYYEVLIDPALPVPTCARRRRALPTPSVLRTTPEKPSALLIKPQHAKASRNKTTAHDPEGSSEFY